MYTRMPQEVLRFSSFEYGTAVQGSPATASICLINVYWVYLVLPMIHRIKTFEQLKQAKICSEFNSDFR